MIRTMTLGGVEVPVLASYDLRTQFSPNVKQTLYTMGDGSTESQTLQGSLNKLRVLITGSGPIPPGLDGLNYNLPLLFQSASERSIKLPNTVFSQTLTPYRRADAGYQPWARASVEGRLQVTPVVMSGDQADLTPVAGADYYQLLWFPEFLAIAEGGGLAYEEDARESEGFWQITLLQK